jgi:putative FmdB family regulatory protein
MPIYEYRCEHGHTFEVMQRITDDPVSSCQLCEAPVERVFHPVAVHFKGSGFYTTDYGRRSESRKDEGESSSSEKASEKKEKKSEKPSSASAEKAAA